MPATRDPAHPVRLAVVLPCFNESESIEAMARSLTSAFGKVEGIRARVVFADDGSTDDTWQRIVEASTTDHDTRNVVISGLQFPHEGKGATQASAIRHVSGQADLVALMDSDGQHDPEALAEAVVRCLDSGLPQVAVRTGYRRSAANRMATWTLRQACRIVGADFNPELGEFMVLPASTAQALSANVQLGIVPIVPLVESLGRVQTFDAEVLDRSDGSTSRFSSGQLWRKALMHLMVNPAALLPRVAFATALMALLLGAYGLAIGISSVVHGTFLGVGSIIVTMILVFVALATVQILTLGMVIVMFRSLGGAGHVHEPRRRVGAWESGPAHQPPAGLDG